MKVLYASYFNAAESKAAKANALYTLKYLSRHVDTTYYDSASHAQFKTLLASLGIDAPLNTLHLPLPTRASRTADQVNRVVYFIAVLLHVLRHRYDFIYTRDLSFAFLWSITPRFLKRGIPIVFESHKIYYLTSSLVSKKKENASYKTIAHFIATTEACKSDLHRIFRIPLEKIDVIRNGIDEDVFNKADPTKLEPTSIKRHYRIKNDAIVVAYAGSLKPWKGAQTFLDATRFLPPDAKIVFLVIGGTETQVRELEKRYPNIVFTGYVDKLELVRLLTISSLGVIPNNSSIEGERYTCPMKLFDYMKADLPIIAADLPSIHELISSPENAVFFSPGDPRSLAEAIQTLIDNPRLQHEIKKANKTLVKRFTWEKKAAALKAIFSTLLPENF